MRSTKKLLILMSVIIMLSGSFFGVQASSFRFNAVAKKEEVRAGDTVKIDMEVSNIEVEEGINVVEAKLEYDETAFESVAFRNANQWITTYNGEEGERKGKFVIVKLVEGVKEEERIGQIQLKLKDDLEEMETEIRIKGITSNNGAELIDEGDRVIKIKIVKKVQNGEWNEGPDDDQDGEQNGGQNQGSDKEQNGGQNGEKDQGSDKEQNGNENGDKNQKPDDDESGDQSQGTNREKNRGKTQEQTQRQNQNIREEAGQKNSYGQEEGSKKEESIVADNLYTGDKIGFIVIIAIVLIGINFIYFVVKMKKLKEEGTEKEKKKILLSAIAAILLMIMVILLAKDVIAFTEEEIEKAIEIVKRENEDNPESIEYLVTDESISRVEPETTIQDLQRNAEGVSVHIQQDEELEPIEDTTEQVKTGMVAKYEENGRTYVISVTGDINGDGILNQIDLTRDIREYVQSEKWKIEKEIERISADVTCDGSIDKKDISKIIEYIVYGNLEIKGVEPVKAPKIEVTSGEEVEEIEEGRYVAGVTVKITQQNEEEKTAKTIYKVIGSTTIEEKEIDKEEEIQLTEPGVYRIISYTYGIEGNKTKGSAIIVIDSAPEIRIEPETWTNGNVKVEIEGKEQYGLQYKIDEQEWREYEGEFEVEENCQVTARMTKGELYGVSAEKKITNIDKEKPTGKIEVTGKGTSKIELTVEGQDEKLSGIKEIRVYIKQKDSEQEYKCQKYTYEEDEKRHDKKIETLLIGGLKAEKEYEIYIEVEDIAGNVFNQDNTEADETTTLIETTEELATPMILATPVQWTAENVKVTIEGEEQYHTEYKVDDGEWVTYEGEFEVEKNCTVTARLIEKENEENISQEITKEITNIDRLAPDITKFEATEIKTNSIQVTVEANDEEETEEYGCSGIAEAGYKFRIKNGDTTNESGYQGSKTFTFKGLAYGTEYTIEVEVKDNCGNIKMQTKTFSTTNQYTITLDNQQATTAGTQKIYEGYETGIYLDAAQTKEMTTGGNPITKPTKQYTLTYNANGGSISGGTTTTTANYTFGGYYTQTNGNGTQMISNTGNITNSLKNTSYSNNTTLYAKWTRNDITLATPTRTGYTFAGWYTEASGGSQITNTSTIISNQTIYAHWTANTYTVQYNGNGNTDGSTANSSHTYNQEKQLTANGFSKQSTVTYNHNYTGSENKNQSVTHTFKNWNTKADGTGTSYNNNASVLNLTTSGVVTLYAQWNSATISTYTPTRDGYTFEGWYTAASGGSQITNTSTITSSQTIYAHWTKDSYSISYNLNGGTVSGNPTTYDVNTNDITLINPTRAGYTFVGWTGSNGTSASTSVKIPKGSTGAKSYTANWVGVVSISDTQTVVAGNELSVSGTAYGDGTLTYEWFYCFNEIFQAGTTSLGKGSMTTGQPITYTATAVDEHYQANSSGYYKLVVTSTIGDTTATAEKTCLVQVQEARYAIIRSGTTNVVRYEYDLAHAYSYVANYYTESHLPSSIRVEKDHTDESDVKMEFPYAIPLDTNGKTITRKKPIYVSRFKFNYLR